MTKIQLFFDGASRGNPGSAGAGAYLDFPTGDRSLFIGLGHATNNQAEYSGIILGLEYLKDHPSHLDEVDLLTVLGDSQLIIKQLEGSWRVKSDNLTKLYQRAKELITHLKNLGITVVLQYIPREKNQIADKLANQGADSN